MGDVLSPPGSSKRQHLQKICIVGGCDDQQLLDDLKERYDVEIYTSSTGDEYLSDKEMTFFVNDFESPAFRRLHETNNGHDDEESIPRIIGPVVLKSRMANGLRLYRPKPRRPIYCDMFFDIVMVMAHETKSIKRRLVDLLHFMGGQARKEVTPVRKTGFYVTETVLGRQYKKATNLGMSVVQPKYLFYCWEQRDNPNFRPLDPQIIAEFAVRTFSKVVICFLGFKGSDLDEMTSHVMNNDGTVVQDAAEATHLVCNLNEPKEWESVHLFTKQKAVTSEWFWICIHTSKLMNEDPYLVETIHRSQTRRSVSSPLRPPVPKTASRSSMDLDRSSHSLLNGTPDYIYSTDDLEAALSPSAKPLDKRQQVCYELLETEQNYLSALGVLLKFRDAIEEEVNQHGAEGIISRSDIQYIFGRLPPIVECHKKILERMKSLLDNWQPDSNVATVWIDAEDDLLSVYPQYINNYETAKGVLEKADASNPKFHVFVKMKENSPEYKRNTLKDLLVRPVQRLPSVILLLKEIQKRSDKDHKDKHVSKKIEDAIGVVNRVLSKANSVCEQTDVLIAQIARFTDVEDVPPHLICSRRNFLCEADAFVVAASDDSEKHRELEKRKVRMMLFNDVIVICKIRNDRSTPYPYASIGPGGTLSKLARQTSLSSLLKHSQKPLRYLMHIPTHFIRNICEVTTEENEHSPGPDIVPLLPAGCPPLYAFIIRQNDSDIVFVLYPDEQKADTMTKLLDFIRQALFMECARDILNERISVESLARCYGITDSVIKFAKKVHQGGNLSLNNSSLGRPQSGFGFRRAISNAGLTVVRGMGFTNLRSTSSTASSRANLANIRECAPSLSPSGVLREELDDSFVATPPKRNARLRLTSTTFVQSLSFRRHASSSTRHLHTPTPSESEDNKENMPRETDV